MGHRSYPRPERARKYAVLHGKPVRLRIAPLMPTGELPPEELARMRRIMDALPTETVTFTAWFRSAD